MNGFPAENIFTFNNNRAEYVNYYTITTGNQDVVRRPTQWKLEGSNNGESWELLDVQNGVTWKGYGQTRFFAIPQASKGYKMFKWTLEASSMDEAETSDVSLYAIDMEVAPMQISYGKDFVFYPGQSVSISPVAKGFTSWSIDPALPTGLSINAVSGLISGTVPSSVSLGPVTYTVSASLEGEEDPLTGEVNINFNNCLGGGYRRVKVDAVNGNRRARQSYDIVSNGVVVETVNLIEVFNSYTGSDTSSTSQTNYFCLPEGTYEMVFHTGSGIDKWVDGSTVTVNTYTHSTASFFVGVYSGMKDGDRVSFSNKFLLDGDMESWTYLADGTVPSGWNSVGFGGSWNTLTTGNTVSQSVWLFRTTVNMDTTQGYNAYELNLNCRAGVVVYLNGAEVYRVGVDGEVTSGTTSTISSSSLKAHVFVGLVGPSYLKEGDNVIAVAVVNSDATEREIDFSAMLTLRAATADMAHGTQLSTSASGGTAGNAFNGNIASKWSTDLEGAWLQFQWTDSQYRVQQVNKFCLVSAANAPGNEPSAFTMSTYDGSSWTQKATYTGVYWTARAQRQCFFIDNPVGINGMKLEFTAVAASESTTVELSLFDFLEENLDKTLPDLAYTPTVISGIKGVAIEPIAPANPYYKSFSSNPNLPAGLQFGSNGAIYGTPTETASGVYTITGISVKGGSSTTTVKIEIKECAADESLLYVHITDTGSRGRYMGYDLIEPISGEVIGSRSEFDNDALYMYHPYCLGPRNYQIVMKDYSRVAWPGTVDILTSSGTVLSSFSVGGSVTPKTEAFFTLEGYSENLEWRYLMDNTDPVANWYTNSFAGQWSTSKLSDMPAPQYTAAYYCASFNLYSASPYATMDVTVTTRGGFILYIDDEENARYNLPQGATDHTTQPVTEDDAAKSIRISVDMSHISNQNNLLCIETHTISIVTENEFNVEVEFVNTSTDMVSDGQMSSSDVGYDDGTWHETNANIFNKNTQDKFNVMNDAAVAGTYHVWAAWTYNNNRRVIINYLRFFAGNNWDRRPKHLDLYGSNDSGATFQTLMTQQVSWETSGGYGYNREFTFTNTVAYNMYKLEIYESINQGGNG